MPHQKGQVLYNFSQSSQVSSFRGHTLGKKLLLQPAKAFIVLFFVPARVAFREDVCDLLPKIPY